MLSLLRLCGLLALVISLASGSIYLHQIKQRDLVQPRTYFGAASLSNMTRVRADEFVRSRINELESRPITFLERGVVSTITLKELGITVDQNAAVAQIPFSADRSTAAVIFASAAGSRIQPAAHFSKTEIMRVLYEKFPTIELPRNASITFANNKFAINEGLSGFRPRIEPIIAQLAADIAFVETRPVEIELDEIFPSVMKEELARVASLLEKEFPKTATLQSGDKKWQIDFRKNPELVRIEKKAYPVASGQLPYEFQWDSLELARYVNEHLADSLEQLPENLQISSAEDGSVVFVGRAVEGRLIERDALLAEANRAFANGSTTIDVPIASVQPKVEVVSPQLQEKGIRDLLAVGHTSFIGSPANRIHNIGVGVAKYNGLMIAPGEEFSFGENLGPVDDSTGYKKELVIKPEGTIPEFGGGLCQVSSTLYRAVIYAGLPVTQRKAHSYAVAYYAQVGGHGLDATVYPPSVDLKFMNDTPGYIVIQSYVDGPHAYFKFYGTADGREVKMEGPYISNRRGAPAEPMLVYDGKLQAGQKKQVEKAHGGFDALWYRFITKNGETVKEEIVSKYRATQNKFLVGDKPAAQAASEIETNPFE